MKQWSALFLYAVLPAAIVAIGSGCSRGARAVRTSDAGLSRAESRLLEPIYRSSDAFLTFFDDCHYEVKLGDHRPTSAAYFYDARSRRIEGGGSVFRFTTNGDLLDDTFSAGAPLWDRLLDKGRWVQIRGDAGSHDLSIPAQCHR